MLKTVLYKAEVCYTSFWRLKKKFKTKVYSENKGNRIFFSLLWWERLVIHSSSIFFLGKLFCLDNPFCLLFYPSQSCYFVFFFLFLFVCFCCCCFLGFFGYRRLVCITCLMVCVCVCVCVFVRVYQSWLCVFALYWNKIFVRTRNAKSPQRAEQQYFLL